MLVIRPYSGQEPCSTTPHTFIWMQPVQYAYQYGRLLQVCYDNQWFCFSRSIGQVTAKIIYILLSKKSFSESKFPRRFRFNFEALTITWMGQQYKRLLCCREYRLWILGLGSDISLIFMGFFDPVNIIRHSANDRSQGDLTSISVNSKSVVVRALAKSKSRD